MRVKSWVASDPTDDLGGSHGRLEMVASRVAGGLQNSITERQLNFEFVRGMERALYDSAPSVVWSLPAGG